MVQSSKNGFYYGWWIVFTGMCLMGVVFSAVVSLPGIFTAPVTREWGVDVSVFTVHTTLSGWTGMLGALIVGKLLQKYNTKLLMASAAVVTAACFLGYSFATQVWHFYVLSAVIGFVSMFIIHIAVALLVMFWFGPKVRGKAMGIAMAGSGIGTMILNPVLAYINTNYNWRMSYRLLALLTIILVPMILAFVVKSPQEKGLTQLGAVEGSTTTKVVGLTTTQAVRSPLFWVVFFTFFLFSLTSLIFMYNAYLYYNAVGFDPVTGASFMSIAALSVTFGKLIIGAACDKWGARIGATLAIMLQILGLVLLIGVSQIPGLAYFAACIFGVGNALATVAVPLIVGELFGNRDYGSLVGICNMGCSLGASMGPLAGSLIFRVSGSYIVMWTTSIVLIVVMLLSMFLAFKIKPGVYAKIAAKNEGLAA